VDEWREAVRQLVELDLRIEDLDSWATDTESVAELERLEAARDDIRDAISEGRVTDRLRRRLEDAAPTGAAAATDPRD
jgi:hypothetical protein